MLEASDGDSVASCAVMPPGGQVDVYSDAHFFFEDSHDGTSGQVDLMKFKPSFFQL